MDWLRAFADRVVPTLVLAMSVTLLSAGVLSYAPSAFGEWRTPEPSMGGGDPLFSVIPPSDLPQPTDPAEPSEAPERTAAPGSSDLPTPGQSSAPQTAPPANTPEVTPPTGKPTGTSSPEPTRAPTDPPPTAEPTVQPTAPAGRGFATRIRIPSLGIDLPIVPSDLVVPGNRDFYPLCDVAMFLRGFVKPGRDGTSYMYAHAQRGMFLPLLRASQVNDGASMLGALVEVYTDDNMLHLYEISRVKRHATDLSLTQVPAGVHQLVLQTSEGTAGHVPKLQVAARPISVVPARAGEATPRPRPRVCLPR